MKNKFNCLLLLSTLIVGLVTPLQGAYAEILEPVPTDFSISFNGTQTALPSDQPLLHHQNKTYVPAKFVIEKLGGSVTWQEKSNTLSISHLDRQDVFEKEGLIVKNLRVIPYSGDFAYAHYSQYSGEIFNASRDSISIELKIAAIDHNGVQIDVQKVGKIDVPAGQSTYFFSRHFNPDGSQFAFKYPRKDTKNSYQHLKNEISFFNVEFTEFKKNTNQPKEGSVTQIEDQSLRSPSTNVIVDGIQIGLKDELITYKNTMYLSSEFIAETMKVLQTRTAYNNIDYNTKLPFNKYKLEQKIDEKNAELTFKLTVYNMEFFQDEEFGYGGIAYITNDSNKAVSPYIPLSIFDVNDQHIDNLGAHVDDLQPGETRMVRFYPVLMDNQNHHTLQTIVHFEFFEVVGAIWE